MRHANQLPWSREASLLLILAVAGCGANLTGASGRSDAGDDDDAPAPPPVALRASAAFDPLAAPLAVTVTTSPGLEVVVDVEDVAGVSVASLGGAADGDGVFAATWDGRSGAGWVPAGAYTLVARVDGSRAATEVAAIRPGFVTAWLEDDDGISAVREPLVWPIDAALQDEADPVAVLDDVDDGERALDFPTVDLATPMALRPSSAEPAAFVFDSRPLLVLEVGADSPALGGTGLELVDVAVTAPGWTVLSGVPLGADPVVLQLDQPLADTVGISTLDVELTFSVDGEALGVQIVPLTIYRLLDVSRFEHPGAIYKPWAPVVHQALGGIDGTTAEHGAVVGALVDWVYHDLGLVYDTVAGASAYSAYLGFQWDRPHFFLSDFLVRRFGNVINCTDAGNILGAYANMVGARLDHLILDPRFDLNEIKAIGRAEYTSCPFGPRGCGFSYHAITTSPGSNLVWDATLMLDGDDDPGAAPYAELLVQAIDGDEYLDRLVRGGNPRYGDMAQETIE